MTTAPATQDQAETELDRIEAWRLHLLLDAGYTRHRAEQLASHWQDVDLHLAIRLLTQGCDQRTALKILL